MITKLKLYKENILVPRNIEGRKEKLRQETIKLLSQETIEGDFTITENMLDIPANLSKVKTIKGNVKVNIGYSIYDVELPEWLKDVTIEGDFKIHGNFKTLKNSPKKITSTYYIIALDELISLQGAENTEVYGFSCMNNSKLNSTKYLPKKIHNFCTFRQCYNLSLLEDFPNEIDYTLIIYACDIKSLKGCPKIINNNFVCDYNHLTSFEDGPTFVKLNYIANNNKITNLKGLPKILYGNLDLSENYYLHTLEDSPEIIHGFLDLNYNENLKSLKNGPKAVYKGITLLGCLGLQNTEGTPYVTDVKYGPPEGKWQTEPNDKWPNKIITKAQWIEMFGKNPYLPS